MMQQFTEGIERIYSNLDGVDDLNEDLDDQEIFDILSDMEADIETGEYTQEEIVDMVANQLGTQLGKEISTEEGARVEEAVEKFYFQLGLDSIPPDRRSRDALAGQQPPEDSQSTKVPPKVEGQPWVHSDDDFLFFLNWLVKKDWSGQKIVDVVAEPHHYTKHYKAFLTQRDKEAIDPLL